MPQESTTSEQRGHGRRRWWTPLALVIGAYAALWLFDRAFPLEGARQIVNNHRGGNFAALVDLNVVGKRGGDQVRAYFLIPHTLVSGRTIVVFRSAGRLVVREGSAATIQTALIVALGTGVAIRRLVQNRRRRNKASMSAV